MEHLPRRPKYAKLYCIWLKHNSEARMRRSPLVVNPTDAASSTASHRTVRPPSPTTPPATPCPKPSSGSKTPAGPPSPATSPKPAPVTPPHPRPRAGNRHFPIGPRPLAPRLSHAPALRSKPQLRRRAHQGTPLRAPRLDPGRSPPGCANFLRGPGPPTRGDPALGPHPAVGPPARPARDQRHQAQGFPAHQTQARPSSS